MSAEESDQIDHISKLVKGRRKNDAGMRLIDS